MQALTPDQLGNLAVTNVKFRENGYLYVYVCDESAMDVYFDNLQIIHYTNPLTEVNDYYPLGLLAKTSTSLGGTPQNYKYNGKELQRDLAFNVLDYGARQYDPVRGRWLQVDPLAEKYRRWSPYNYAVDNPVRFIDPDGMAAYPIPDIKKSENIYHRSLRYYEDKDDQRFVKIRNGYSGSGNNSKPVEVNKNGKPCVPNTAVDNTSTRKVDPTLKDKPKAAEGTFWNRLGEGFPGKFDTWKTGIEIKGGPRGEIQFYVRKN